MLEALAGILVGWGLQERLAHTIAFFIYDSIKILVLLFVLIAAIGYARTYLSPDKVKRWLASKNPIAAYTAAASLGAVTPFCSCSSIPIYLGLLSAGAPLGVALTFLITSPLVNQYVLVLMLGAFGIKIAALYLIAGMTIGILGGALLSRLGLERHLERLGKEYAQQAYTTRTQRLQYGLKEASSITKKLWPWVIAGVGVGAIIHNYVPQSLIDNALTTGTLGVPIAAILGVPLYGSGVALVPIAEALFSKGLPLGTALAFLMSTVGLSVPAAVILRRAMRLPLILWFFAVVTAGIIIVGYLFNLV